MARRQLRDRIEITARILDACTEERRKTPIMYGVGLSYDQVSYYLNVVQERKMVEEVKRDGETYYKTTAKGRDFLSSYLKMKSLLEGGSGGQPTFERYAVTSLSRA